MIEYYCSGCFGDGPFDGLAASRWCKICGRITTIDLILFWFDVLAVVSAVFLGLWFWVIYGLFNVTLTPENLTEADRIVMIVTSGIVCSYVALNFVWDNRPK